MDMGLFDRIKKVFTGTEPEEKPDPQEIENQQTEESEPGVLDSAQTEKNRLESTKELQETSPQSASSITEDTTVNELQETAKYEEGLKKTRKSFSRRLNELFANFRYVDEDFFEELEDALIESDVGFEATMAISDVLRQEARVENVRNMKDAERVIIRTMVDMFEDTDTGHNAIFLNPDGLTVILFVGVNGVGKTTSIAKMAHLYQKEGKKVVLAAGDTFRAGAIEQLKVWGDRLGTEVIATKQGGDPAAVVYDSIKEAQKQEADILMIDTAGRLQNKRNLMNELDKMKRVISREVPDAPHEVLLVLDATTGQNALIQAKQFKETTNVTGIILTKLDGTAKGGIVLAINKELGIPVKFAGLGESMDDLQEFDLEKFAYGLFKDLIMEA